MAKELASCLSTPITTQNTKLSSLNSETFAELTGVTHPFTAPESLKLFSLTQISTTNGYLKLKIWLSESKP